ncbi:unnamed protein product, partial [Scytosiphon promiscuus]
GDSGGGGAVRAGGGAGTAGRGTAGASARAGLAAREMDGHRGVGAGGAGDRPGCRRRAGEGRGSRRRPDRGVWLGGRCRKGPVLPRDALGPGAEEVGRDPRRHRPRDGRLARPQ